ncbi:MAG TPA: hypothetical protein VHA78_00300 [Candidatus Peribacteraceae bacterium]|nr:hypothetical protein [Candidatus Peribacteraceae bacterium]
MARVFRASAFLLTIALAACSSASAYPFPTQLPSKQVLDTQYQALHHDLSPLPKYHFRIQIPKEWKVLKVDLEKEPEKGGLADVAIFRQPGNWMNDPTQPINGEIAINVVNLDASGASLTPEAWLDNVLQKNAKGFTELARRTSPSSSGPVPDVLIKYMNGSQTLISRMMAFKSGNDMFVITCSDTADEYKQNAEAYNVAISTFRLDSAGDQPLMSGTGVKIIRQ